MITLIVYKVNAEVNKKIGKYEHLYPIILYILHPRLRNIIPRSFKNEQGIITDL